MTNITLKHYRTFCWIGLLGLLLVACGGGDVALSPDEIPVDSLTGNASAGPTVAVVATVPPATETAVPTATIPPTQTPIPPTPVVSEDPRVPQNLLLDYATGDYGAPILQQKLGQMRVEPLPSELGVELFFDYAPQHGLLAFGRSFWQGVGPEGIDSVTDLWVYDFATEELTQWFDGNVGRAAWSTDPTQPPTLAIALHNGEAYDLVLAQEPQTAVGVIENIGLHFSWAEGQSRLAYVQDGRLLTINPFTEIKQRTAVSDLDTSFGWIGDEPIWASRNDFLIYPADPFIMAPVNGDDAFRPVDGEGQPLALTARPFKMLWSETTNQLVVQAEEFTRDMVIYTFSRDMNTVVQVTTVANVRVGFLTTDGEGVVVLDELGSPPQIYSLLNYDFVN